MLALLTVPCFSLLAAALPGAAGTPAQHTARAGGAAEAGAPDTPALEIDVGWQSGRVLQRGQPLTLRGRAPGARRVGALLGAAAAEAEVIEGCFELCWPPQEPARDVNLIVATESGQRLELLGLAIGDVWLIGGQSNASLPLAETGEAEALLTAPGVELLRCWTVTARLCDQAPEHAEGHWTAIDARTAPGLSALALHFGQWRAAATGIPQGLIVAALPDSTIEGWISKPALAADPELAPLISAYESALRELPKAQAEFRRRLAEFEAAERAALAAGRPAPRRRIQPPLGPDNHKRPWALFTGTIAPLRAERLAGVIWYQGESNATEARLYPLRLRTLIADWRRNFGRAELPFLVVQLPGFGPLNPDPPRCHWARLREAQRRVVAGDAHAGLAIAIDLGAGEDMHPPHKRELGRRLAALADALLHGAGPASSGPVPSAFEPRGGGFVVRFSGALGELRSRGELTGFELLDPAGTWWPAPAALAEGGVWVGPLGFEARAVRYAFRDQPESPLRDSQGRVASPFSSAADALEPGE
jgi:sialate O-acetylesterase